MLFVVWSPDEDLVVEACWLFDDLATLIKSFLIFPFSFNTLSCIWSTWIAKSTLVFLRF